MTAASISEGIRRSVVQSECRVMAGMKRRTRLVILACVWLVAAALPAAAQRDDDPSAIVQIPPLAADTGAVSRLLAEATSVRRSDPKKALELGERAEQIARKSGDSYGWSNALVSKCISCIVQGDVSNALRYAINAASIKETISDQPGLAAVYSTIGTLYSKSGDGERALDFHTRALKYYERVNDLRGLSNVKNNIGLLYMNSGSFENALRFFNQSIALKEELNDKPGLANSFVNIGIVYRNSGVASKAEDYFRRAVRLFEELADNYGVAFSYTKLASLAMARKRYNDVLADAGIALPLARGANARDIVRDLYLLMSDAHAGLGDNMKALDHYRLYTSLKDSLFNASNARVIANMAARYDIDRRDREIELLTRLRDEEQARLQTEARNRDAQIRLLEQEKLIKDLEVQENATALREQMYKAENKEKELRLERKEKDMFRDRAKVEELAKQKREQFLTFAVVGLVLLALILVLLFRGYQSRKRSEARYRVKNEELETANAEILRHEKVVQTQAALIENANRELHLRNRELEMLNMEKNEFLGIAAHDLKNPLIMIRSLAEMMIAPVTTSKVSVLEYAEYIYKGADHMIGLVSNLLDVNAIESGGFLFHCSDTNLLPIAEKVIATYRQRAEEKNLALKLECPPDLPFVNVDESATEQILDNLVSNAIKYSMPDRNVYVRLKAFYSVARIEIEDEGPGIKTQDLPRLFQKFVRLEAQPTGHEYSTGLGLSIVKKLAEAMQGNVWCESIYGTGSMFCVELPLAQMRIPASGEAELPTAVTGNIS
jgi:signal transduction histidine kinase/tetratricopeptide (TPR) repeat protein